MVIGGKVRKQKWADQPQEALRLEGLLKKSMGEKGWKCKRGLPA